MLYLFHFTPVSHYFYLRPFQHPWWAECKGQGLGLTLLQGSRLIKMDVRFRDINLTNCSRGKAEWDHMILFKRRGRLFFCLFVFSKNTSCICLAHAGFVVTPCQRDLTLQIIYPWNNSGFCCLCWIITFLSEKQNCCGQQYTPACVFICSGECITAQTACIRLASADFIR